MANIRELLNKAQAGLQNAQAVSTSDPKAIAAVQKAAAEGNPQAKAALQTVQKQYAERAAAVTNEAVQGGVDARNADLRAKIAADPLYGLSDAQRQEYQANQQLQSKFGSDFSWLDPTFQYAPTLLGQSAGSQVYTDPGLQDAQYSAMGQAQQLANEKLKFQDPRMQQGYLDRFNEIANGGYKPTFTDGSQQQKYIDAISGVQAPDFTGAGNQQQQALDQLNAMQMPTFDPADKARQQQAFESAMGMSSNTGPGALKFDDGSRQQEQYDNLRGIIAGGGATEIERASRANARADSESWLRGQREADMQDYAERGLTGSGQELLALSADRQGAAQRNSLADLNMASDLEKRRMDAITSAGGLATDMRGNTIQEQSLLNSAKTTGLGFASDIANAMRNAGISEQSLLSQTKLGQLGQISDLTSNMRQQNYQEGALKTNTDLQKFIAALQGSTDLRSQDNQNAQYLDKRMLDALQSGSNLSSDMRNQQYQEQIGQRNATQSALDLLGNLSTNIRGQQFNEGSYRASSADDFARYNQDAINTASSQNVSFLQNAYRDLMQRQQEWAINNLNNNTRVAQGQQNFDQTENVNASNQATNLGTSNTNTFNNGLNNYNQQLLDLFNTNAGLSGAVNRQVTSIYPQAGAVAGQGIDQLIAAMSGGGGAMGATGGGGSTGTGTGTSSNFDWSKFLQTQPANTNATKPVGDFNSGYNTRYA